MQGARISNMGTVMEGSLTDLFHGKPMLHRSQGALP
jgi:hypothetical protein